VEGEKTRFRVKKSKYYRKRGVRAGILKSKPRNSMEKLKCPGGNKGVETSRINDSK